MKTTIATLVIASTIATSLTPAQAGMISLGGAQRAADTTEAIIHKTKGRGTALAAGMIAGMLMMGAAASASRAASRHANICRRWLNSCNNGSERSCWKYDTKCR